MRKALIVQLFDGEGRLIGYAVKDPPNSEQVDLYSTEHEKIRTIPATMTVEEAIRILQQDHLKYIA